MLNMAGFLSSLPIMLKGMCGIFLVIIIICLLVYILRKFF